VGVKNERPEGSVAKGKKKKVQKEGNRRQQSQRFVGAGGVWRRAEIEALTQTMAGLPYGLGQKEGQ